MKEYIKKTIAFYLANDNFENKRNQFFFKSIKKGTKWVVHEQ